MSGFDDLPEDDATPKKSPVRKVTTAKAAPPDEGKVVLTLKGGSGFDAPWIVIHANDIADAHDHLHGENATLLVEVMESLGKAADKFVEVYAGSKSSGAGRKTASAPSGAGEAPPGTPEAPGPGWQYKTGVNGKTGKTWRAWMPPRDSDEKPVWL